MTAWDPITDVQTALGAVITQQLMRAIQYNIRALAEDDATVPLANVITRLGRQAQIVIGPADIGGGAEQVRLSGALALSGSVRMVGGQYIYTPSGDMYIRPGTGGKIRFGANAVDDLMQLSTTGELVLGTDPGGSALARVGGSVSIRVPMIWPAVNSVGQLTNDGSGGLSWAGGSAVAAFWAGINNATTIAITGAVTATANRFHKVTGTAGDYTITMPAAPANGDVVGFSVGDNGIATKQYTLDAGGVVKIAGRTRYLILLHTNVALFIYDSASTTWLPLVLSLDTPWVNAGASTITAVTSNPTKGGGTTYDRVFWRRVGGGMQLRYEYRHTTAGAAGSGDYLWGLPIGTIDTNFVTADTAASSSNSLSTAGVGYGSLDIAGTSAHLWIGVYDGTRLRFNYVVGAGGGTNWMSSGTAAFSNVAFRYHATAELPMTNW